MSRKKNIEDIKKNKGVGAHPPFLAGDFLHWRSTFEAFKKRNEQPQAEYMRLVLVAMVSLFESFYKEIFARYIDAGDAWLNRAEKLHSKYKPEINFEVLKGLSKSNFSIGDLYAYTLKYGSFEQIAENYETLTGERYYDRIKQISIYAWPQDLTEIRRARKKADEIFKLIPRVFVLRHALVHEYPATDTNVTLDELLEYLDCGWLLTMATDRLYWRDTGKVNWFLDRF